MATRNKRFLLDTNVLIWAMENNPRLGESLPSILKDRNNLVFVSVASIWEIVIKMRKTPLKVPKSIVKGIELAGFTILSIEALHIVEIEKLPQHHRDPFDRMLIAQAKAEGLTLITSNKKIWKYRVKLLKA